MTLGVFRHGHAAAGDWETAVRACLRQVEPGTASANLGFVYATDAFAPHMGPILDFLRLRTGIDDWVGTVGLGVCGPGVEYFERPALTILTGKFPGNSFRVFSTVANGFEDFESHHRGWCNEAQPHFGVVHGDPRNPTVASLVHRLTERMDSGFLVGGLASSRGEYVQIANGVTHGGISGVLFANGVAVTTRLTQGCSPIGRRHEITRCQENLVLEIDGRPSLDVFYEDVGEVLARNPARLAGYIFAGLPVKGSDTGDYLVRNIVGIDPTNRLIAIGDVVEPGDSLMFCRRDAQSAEEDMVRMLDDIRRSLDAPPRGGIYHTCLARGPNLFGPNSEELRLIERELGTFPLVGFFANGEISHDRLYGYTGVLTLFA